MAEEITSQETISQESNGVVSQDQSQVESSAQSGVTQSPAQNEQQTSVSTELTLEESVANAMAVITEQLQAQKDAAYAEIAAQQATAPSLTQADKAAIDALYKQLEQALAQNASFITKTDLSLRGVVELVAMIRQLNEYYTYYLSTLKDNKEAVDKALVDIDVQNKTFSAMASIAGDYIKLALKQMDGINQSCLDLRNELEILHDDTQKDLLTTQNYIDIAKNTLAKLQELESKFGDIDSGIKEAEVVVSQHEKILNDMKEFVSVEITKAQTQLFTKKEEYERDMQATRDTFLSTFNTMLTSIQNQASEFAVNANQIKLDTTNTINDVADNRINEIRALDTEVSEKLNQIKETRLAELNSTYNALLENLNTQVDMMRTEFNTARDIVIQNINDLETKTINNVTKAKDSQAALLEDQANRHMQDLESMLNNNLDTISIKGDDYLKQFAERQTQLITAAEGAIDTKKESVFSEIDQKKDAILQAQEAAKVTLFEDINNRSQQITAVLNEAKTDAQTTKQAIISEIQTKGQESVDLQESKRDELVTELNNIKNECASLMQSSFTLAQVGMKKETFTANTTWTKPSGVTNISVSLRGGTGVTQSTTAGGVSSFGSYATALGGAGNQGGSGQWGQYVFAFASLDDSVKQVEISVATGGEVSIYYPLSLATITAESEKADESESKEESEAQVQEPALES